MFIPMGIRPLFSALLALSLVLPATAEVKLVSAPPLGWNSWDSYGLTINESQFRANMAVLNAQLKQFGWEYVVIDAGWYLENPQDSDTETLRYDVNAQGQYIPARNRFPSAVNDLGFTPLSDAAHDHGLKFGIHIMRGVPKQTFLANPRIGRTRFRVAAATDPADVCPWNPDNFGVKANAAGQAWYDALMLQYANWGVDFLKVDCIASNPYKGAEIRMIHKAIARAQRETGHAMVLSLSPGPTAVENALEVGTNAQLWRISNDVWDLWDNSSDLSQRDFPQSVKAQFPLVAKWAGYARPGNWPDADMLPIGQLGPAPGWGKPRATRLTEDEQRTMLTLWIISRSPLFLGANLTEMDGYTTSLITNPEVIEVDQESTENRQVSHEGDLVVWEAKSTTTPTNYLAVFNLGDTPVKMDKTLAEFGYKDRAQYQVRDLWQRKEMGPLNEITLDLPPHASVLLSLKP
jgi:alpha-galactosidase